MTKKSTFAAVLISAALFAGTAFADVSAEADQLFKQGQELLADKKVDAACAAFERSEKLEPRGGTLLSLAYCHEQQGRISLAYVEYDEALRRLRVGGGRQDRERFALDRMSALRGQVVMVTVELSEATKGTNPEIVVVPSKMGEQERKVVVGPDRRVQVPLDVDGGGYRIEVRAPQYKAFSGTVTVAGPTATPASLQVGDLTPEPGAVAARPGVPNAPEPDGSGQRTLGLIIGGTGLAFAAVGGVFGALALGCASDYRRDGSCDPDKAKVFYANGANIGLGLGAVGLVAGGYLYLSAPKGNGQPQVGIGPAALPGGGALSMTGRF